MTVCGIVVQICHRINEEVPKTTFYSINKITSMKHVLLS